MSQTYVHAKSTFITKAIHVVTYVYATNGLYSTTAVLLCGYHNMRFNSKVTSTNDTNYSFHIKLQNSFNLPYVIHIMKHHITSKYNLDGENTCTHYQLSVILRNLACTSQRPAARFKNVRNKIQYW